MLARLPAPLRAAGLYAGAMVWTKGLGLLLLPVITALLPAAEYGRMEFLCSAAEIAALVAGAGLVDTLYRFGSEPGSAGRRSAAQVAGLALMVSLGGLGLALLLSPLGALLPMPATTTEVALLGVTVALEAAIGVPLAWLRMQGRAAHYAALVVARGTLHSALLALLLWQGFGVAGMLAAGAVGSLLAALALMGSQARSTGIRLAPNAWKHLLAYGLPLTAGGLASFFLGTADRWFLAGTVSAAELGQYALAAKLGLVMAFLTQPFDLWFYPRRIALYGTATGPGQVAKLSATGAAVTLCAAALAALAGPLLIRWATPAAYHGAAGYVPWLCAALALQSLGSLFNIGCYLQRTGRQSLLVNGGAGLVALAAYAVLIPRCGVAGAVAATLLAQAARLVWFAWLSQRSAPLAYGFGRVALLGLACAAVAALPQLLAPLPTLAMAPAALVCLATLAVRLGLLPRPRLGTARLVLG